MSVQKKYQLLASEGGKAPEPVAIFESLKEARKMLTIAAAKMGHRRIKKDMWSNGKSFMFIKSYYPWEDL